MELCFGRGAVMRVVDGALQRLVMAEYDSDPKAFAFFAKPVGSVDQSNLGAFDVAEDPIPRPQDRHRSKSF